MSQERLDGSKFLTDQLIVQRYWDGGHRKVVDSLPGEDDIYSLRESSSEVGKPEGDYPRERDSYTVTRYSACYEGKVRSEYKVFDIQFDTEQHPDEAERFEELLDALRQLPELEDELGEYGSFDELIENKGSVRQYQSLYGVLKRIWEKDSLAEYATKGRQPQMFEIEQYPHGFYRIPGLYHGTANQVIGDKLQSEDLGDYSVAWGGFLVRPEDFTEVHELLKPFYRTPSDTKG